MLSCGLRLGVATVKLAVADDAFALGADVDEDLVLVDADDAALDDVAVLEALDLRSCSASSSSIVVGSGRSSRAAGAATSGAVAASAARRRPRRLGQRRPLPAGWSASARPARRPARRRRSDIGRGVGRFGRPPRPLRQRRGSLAWRRAAASAAPRRRGSSAGAARRLRSRCRPSRRQPSARPRLSAVRRRRSVIAASVSRLPRLDRASKRGSVGADRWMPGPWSVAGSSATAAATLCVGRCRGGRLPPAQAPSRPAAVRSNHSDGPRETARRPRKTERPEPSSSR